MSALFKLLGLAASVSLLSGADAAQTFQGKLTFYAAGDNCPPGGTLAYGTIHKVAGGVGTYADPVTIAGYKAVVPVGARVYIPHYKKYFVHEDECYECRNDWNNKNLFHMDGWLGPDNIMVGTTNCETTLSRNNVTFIVDPPSDYAVDTTSFFTNGQCMLPVTDPCTDGGTECGNSCQLPTSMSCSAAAKMFLLTLSRFEELNPGLNCGSNIPAGKTVCQAGRCGGP